MGTTKKGSFLKTDAAEEIRLILKHMVADAAYNTKSTYSANTILYPDNRISFVERHMIYLNDHPGMSPKDYVANLRLRTKIR